MGEIKLRRVGPCSFSHAYSSTLWKKARGIIYDDAAKESISIDSLSLADYVWIHESKSIIPHIYDQMMGHTGNRFNSYKRVFTHYQPAIELFDNARFAPACGYWIDDPKIYAKTKAVSFITSNKTMCEGHRNRLAWVAKFKGQCDLYGKGIKDIKNKEEGLCDYRFSIAIENGKYETYFTEKVLDCFATGTIPIYYGCNGLDNYFNPKGVIRLTDDFKIDDLTEDLYYSKLDAIKENLERVMDYYTVEDWIVKNKGFEWPQ